MDRRIEKVIFKHSLKKQYKRVAAYARVSSGKDAMLHSLSAQISYYNQLIQSHNDWLFCGVFADEALTGTKDNREKFQELLQKCRNKEIDLIITKSISRFARNTVTLLETVRELKSLNVDVYFEEQNIHTMSSDGELMLTILASYAQEESKSVSDNMKWRIRNDFKEGKVWHIHMFGYKRTPEGSLEIIPDEANVVKLIFKSYIEGMSRLAIANMLNDMGVIPKNGGKWGSDSIARIIRNEKYAGDMLLQKTYKSDHLTKRKMINDGKLPKYFVEESHPAIIDKETFLKANELIEKKHFTSNKTKSVFSRKIFCGCCGKNYNRKRNSVRVMWLCATFNNKGKKYCPTAKQIPEETLIDCCCQVLNTLEFDENLFSEKIEKIIVPEPNSLTFIFKDGSEQNITWKDRSRSESWTPEMKEEARRRSCRKSP